MLIRTLATSLLLTTLGACSESNNSVDACENFAISFVTLDKFQQPVDTFSTSDTVRFVHTAKNISDQQQTVTGTNPPRDCSLRQVEVLDSAGNSIYSDGDDRPRPVPSCAATPLEEVFAPGETKTYTADWNQPRSDNQPSKVQPGSYTARYYSGLGKCGSSFDKSKPLVMQ
jgi:hypothetical protein